VKISSVYFLGFDGNSSVVFSLGTLKSIALLKRIFSNCLRVATGNPVVFTLSPPECYMEVRHGYGITGTRVSGPVRVGDPLTLLIYMRSKYGEQLKKKKLAIPEFHFCAI
jgi:hypothetical protein